MRLAEINGIKMRIGMFLRLMLFIVAGPLIILAWIMICFGERKETCRISPNKNCMEREQVQLSMSPLLETSQQSPGLNFGVIVAHPSKIVLNIEPDASTNL